MTICNQCQVELSRKDRRNKFCSRSCAATYNNSRRSPRSAESRQKTSISIKYKIANGLVKNGHILHVRQHVIHIVGYMDVIYATHVT
jgi:hypothetical protein